MKTQLVIFGITGDLAGRKLLPALDSIVSTTGTDDIEVIGVSRHKFNVADLLTAHQSLCKVARGYTMDLAEKNDYKKLKQYLKRHKANRTLFYLAVPPSAATTIVDFLGETGLNTERYSVLFEKPFGFDLHSAIEFIERTARYFKEDQIYRIDHYMAKEISKELLRIKRDAENQKHTWGKDTVKAVTVMATEKIGIEGRVQFYEQTGALRDFVQGHLMQLLSLVLMKGSTIKSLPSQRWSALLYLNPVDPLKATRAQYDGYQTEVNNPGSQTETFVGFGLESSDQNWRGVPIRLVTGKALSEKRSLVKIEYLDGNEDVFDEDELTKKDEHHLDAYARVLQEAIAGRKDIFISSPEVIRSWEILTPLQEAWSMEVGSLPTYPKGVDLTALPSA